MKKKLFVQDVQVAPQKPNKKSVKKWKKWKKWKKLRRKFFKLTFHCIEALWMLTQIVQYLLQIFK